MLIKSKSKHLEELLSDKRVVKAREKFEANAVSHNSIVTLTFDELLEKFSLDCNSFSSIAAVAGVSRQRITQIYNQYFRDIFGKRKSGRVRQKVCSTIKAIDRVAAAKTRIIEGKLKVVADRARATGCEVEASVGGRHGSTVRVHSTRLVINGKECRIMSSTYPHFTSGHTTVPYYSFDLCRSKHSFYILVTPEWTFILPYGVIKHRMGKNLYVPLETREVTRERVKARPGSGRQLPGPERDVDVWQYLERWDLIQ